jgi:ElaB/YqjD/DUF883 family membrane-anchored ribosome-binding protein
MGAMMKKPAASATAREKLEKDLKLVMAEAEELLKATAGQAGDHIQSVRARVEETIASAKAEGEDLEGAAIEGAKSAARAADSYVHENPWPAIGIAAGLGLIAGWVLGRK